MNKFSIPTALQPWVFDFRRVRFLSLLLLEEYLLSAGTFGVFSGDRKWHWDSFMFWYIAFFWKANFRWFVPGALLILGILLLSLDLRGKFPRLELWVNKRTGYVSLLNPKFTWRNWILDSTVLIISLLILPVITGATRSWMFSCFIVLVALLPLHKFKWASWPMASVVTISTLLLVPPITGATHSWMFTWLMLLVALVPIGMGLLLCSIQGKPGPAELAIIPCKSKLIAYDVRVKDGCLPNAVAQIRLEYIKEDRSKGTEGDIWKWLRPRMEQLYRNLETFFGGAVGRDHLVFTESAWDAFGRILDQHATSLDKVLTTTIEPYEITTRMNHSAVAGKVQVLNVSDEPNPRSKPEDAIITAIREAVHLTPDPDTLRRSHKSFMLILSHVDCRRGNILDLAKIFQACKAIGDEINAKFIFVINGQLSLGNIVLEGGLLAQCHYLVTDGCHWLRGADDLGLIIFGGQEAKVPPLKSEVTKLPEWEEWVSVKPAMLASFGFAVAEHANHKKRQKGVPATGRKLSLELLSFGKCLELVVRGGSEVIERLKESKSVQGIVSRHSKDLASAFATKFNDLIQPKSDLGICVDPPESGMVVLYSNGATSIEDLRKLLADKMGVQCKMLGSNDLERPVLKMDRLRFCFQYFHGSDDVDLVINAIQGCL